MIKHEAPGFDGMWGGIDNEKGAEDAIANVIGDLRVDVVSIVLPFGLLALDFFEYFIATGQHLLKHIYLVSILL